MIGTPRRRFLFPLADRPWIFECSDHHSRRSLLVGQSLDQVIDVLAIGSMRVVVPHAEGKTEPVVALGGQRGKGSRPSDSVILTGTTLSVFPSQACSICHQR
jgi:hypothetical protein